MIHDHDWTRLSRLHVVRTVTNITAPVSHNFFREFTGTMTMRSCNLTTEDSEYVYSSSDSKYIAWKPDKEGTEKESRNTQRLKTPR